MGNNYTIMWFIRDLRLVDNPALHAATQSDQPIIPLYIHDSGSDGRQVGAAGRCWLHYSLEQLQQQLDGKLHVMSGDPLTLLPALCERLSVKRVVWNHLYEPALMARDAKLKRQLQQQGVNAESFNGSLLWQPTDISKADGSPYKVYTPFYRRGCLQAESPRQPLSQPRSITWQTVDLPRDISELKLLPTRAWGGVMMSQWRVGERAARRRLQQFIKTGLSDYKSGRNFPSRQHVSRLSPHLHWGEISPHTVWHAVASVGDDKDIDHFLSELGWREFSYYLLYHFPQLPKKNFLSRFDQFPWRNRSACLQRWQTGETGCPIVDAGMRELWQTGYMHNRVRMIVASFLVKNLLVHWRHGEQWFWDCLVDADLANNSASWQWVAGCGADAAPYFRIFNPVLQGQKFDSAGDYTKHYVPELAQLPERYLFAPWQAPQSELDKAGVCLGKTYPQLIVDLAESRRQALAAYEQTR